MSARCSSDIVSLVQGVVVVVVVDDDDDVAVPIGRLDNESCTPVIFENALAASRREMPLK